MVGGKGARKRWWVMKVAFSGSISGEGRGALRVHGRGTAGGVSSYDWGGGREIAAMEIVHGPMYLGAFFCMW